MRDSLEKIRTPTLKKQYRQLSEMCDLLQKGQYWSNINYVRLAIHQELRIRGEVL